MRDAFTVTIPRLVTERLLLREMRPTDLDAFFASASDAEGMKYIGGPVDRRTATRIFTSAAGQWVVHGAGWWIIEERATEKPVGTVGAFYRETSPDIEIGWTVFPPHWRRGIATEAAKAALAHAFDVRGAPRATALIDADNAPSLAVGKKLGMAYEGDVELFGERVGRYIVHR